MSIVAATGGSTHPDAESAVEEAWARVIERVPSPSLVLMATTIGYDLDAVRVALRRRVGDTPFMGGTSCGGVMTDKGFYGVDGRGLALFALSDVDGDFGVGTALLGNDPRAAARRAVEAALADAGRAGQLPSAVWMVTTPGGEEAVVQGIADVVGEDMPLVGGSAADNTLEGRWRQITPGGVLEDHVCVAVLFTSADVTASFQSGYDPTAHTGTVTRAEGRTVYEIDGRPAARVYDRWTGGAITQVLDQGGGEVLSKTNLCPLGRFLREVRGVPYFVLSHPERATPDGALGLFTDVQVGEQFVCMTGSVDGLVARAGNVARSALTMTGHAPEQARAALMIFCGGCLLTVRERIAEVHANIRRELGGIPFLTMFTFGEQGRIVDVGNRHGNLMISTLVLTERAA
ncbi:MAG: FIST N-terminal domain-containing protein [Minicystis sp.]